MPFLHELSETILKQLSDRAASNEPIGVQTGIQLIDSTLGGLPRQTLSYLVGDSGVGKSWLATHILLHAAKWLQKRGRGPTSVYTVENAERKNGYRSRVQNKEGKKPIVVFWSLEMAEGMVVARMMTQLTKMVTGISMDSGKLLQGKVDDLDALVEGYKSIQEIGQHIFPDFRDQTIEDLRSTIEELSMQYDVCLIIVDYFRLIQDVIMSATGAGRQEQVSRELMAVARDYDTHVMSIFDLNREGQKSKRPQLFHLKWGTAAQYDADYVFMMWWDEETKKRKEEGENIEFARVILELAKARNAALNRTELWFELACGGFEPYKKYRRI